jgi:diguanylate cyclase (GGDEF)-like protein
LAVGRTSVNVGAVIAPVRSSGANASSQMWGVVTSGRSDRLRARAAGSLYLIGSALGFVSLALFTGREADRPSLAITLGIAAAIGAGLLRFGPRLALWAYQLVPAVGTLIICALLYDRGGGAGAAYTYFFIWVGLWSFYFLTLRAALAQVGLIALLFGLELIIAAPGGSPAEHWLLVVGTAAVSGLLVARLAEQLQRRTDQMAQLLNAAHELSEVTDAAGARPIICRALLRVSEATFSVLYEPNADGSALLLTASAGADLPKRSLPFVGEHSNSVTAFTTMQPVFVSKLAGDAQSHRDLLEATGMSSGLWQPVIRHGRPVGVLGVLWANGLDHLPAGLRELIAMLAAEAATTIERADLMARLETVARTDDLTGLLNRRAWCEELPRELSLAARAGQPLTVLMLDLDNFKAFNDAHGHLAGDRLLKQFAGAWSARLRTTDLLARYGGEEFTLVLPGCDLAEGLALADTLREIRPDSQTCSVGVALWDRTETADELLDRADKALYEAKRLGRDRSVTAI